ncbi:cytochrome c and c1 heme-lyase [Violaceomyces palustris]|uniref:Cytochrome c and c1 heme-lyase n=1 Tax=Violaceomyces palustris TaxID=1673888 RepID=A0ACD0NRL8_9BASI|nr:cytochrome c and c1 heme-lyase [Violaceomyces palustris]
MVWPFTSSSPTVGQGGGDSNDKCPVDHETKQRWLQANPGSKQHPFSSTSTNQGEEEDPSSKTKIASGSKAKLSTEREISSIPRLLDDGKGKEEGDHWVYPSQDQFYKAMARKNHNPREEDMNVVVPIHNAVNERAWKEILDWERMWSKGESVVDPKASQVGPKLVNFKGRPNDLTWRAWFRGLAGYQHPFDRHDWTIDRQGHRVRYIIDFYSGRSSNNQRGLIATSQQLHQDPQQQQQQVVSFYLDVRPAPDTLEGIGMRAKRLWTKWFS